MISIISGVSRTGKSTVAKHLSKIKNISYLPFDSVISTLEKFCPAAGIKHCYRIPGKAMAVENHDLPVSSI